MAYHDWMRIIDHKQIFIPDVILGSPYSIVEPFLYFGEGLMDVKAEQFKLPADTCRIAAYKRMQSGR
jgi:hypothetical protein